MNHENDSVGFMAGIHKEDLGPARLNRLMPSVRLPKQSLILIFTASVLCGEQPSNVSRSDVQLSEGEDHHEIS